MLKTSRTRRSEICSGLQGKCLQRSENSPPCPHPLWLFPRKWFCFSFASVLMRWMLEQNIHKREKERKGDWKRAHICRGYAKWRLNWFRLSQRINSWGSTAGHFENPKPHTHAHSWLNFIVLISNQLYTDISIQMLHIHHPNHHYTEQMCVYKHPACPSVNEPLWKPSCVERRRWGHFFRKAFTIFQIQTHPLTTESCNSSCDLALTAHYFRHHLQWEISLILHRSEYCPSKHLRSHQMFCRA